MGKTCIIKRKRSVYSYRRYWYHLSMSLTKDTYTLIPWDNAQGYNRSDLEPNTKRICVAPSIAQCMTALPYISGTYNVYRTRLRVLAKKPHDIFDAKITEEGWIDVPTDFIKVGTFKISDIEERENIKNVITEAASGDCIRSSTKVFKWWKKINFRRHMNYNRNRLTSR